MDWLTIAGNVLFSAMPEQSMPPRNSPLNEAVTELRRRGLSVGPADGVPGLWSVTGHPELTTNQVIDLAARPSPLHLVEEETK